MANPIAPIMSPTKKAAGSPFSLVDALSVAGLKVVNERLLTPVVGNGTIVSGGVKVVASALIGTMMKSKFGGAWSTALMVDGAEDIVNWAATSFNIPFLSPQVAETGRQASTEQVEVI